jgi:hypothetical protein
MAEIRVDIGDSFEGVDTDSWMKAESFDMLFYMIYSVPKISCDSS